MAKRGCVAELVYACVSEAHSERIGSSSLPAPTCDDIPEERAVRIPDVRTQGSAGLHFCRFFFYSVVRVESHPSVRICTVRLSVRGRRPLTGRSVSHQSRNLGRGKSDIPFPYSGART